MSVPKTFSDIVHQTLTGNCVEPVKRVKDLNHVPRGLRNRRVLPRYIGHRFEIKGGIPRTRVIAENIESHNTLLKRLIER